MTKNYHQLEQFLGAYFHEDWDLEGETWKDNVFIYLETSTQDENRSLSRQIEDFIQDSEFRVIDVNTLQSNFSCYYNFDADGITAIEWLSKILKILEE